MTEIIRSFAYGKLEPRRMWRAARLDSASELGESCSRPISAKLSLWKWVLPIFFTSVFLKPQIGKLLKLTFQIGPFHWVEKIGRQFERWRGLFSLQFRSWGFRYLRLLLRTCLCSQLSTILQEERSLSSWCLLSEIYTANIAQMASIGPVSAKSTAFCSSFTWWNSSRFNPANTPLFAAQRTQADQSSTNTAAAYALQLVNIS